MIGEASVPYWDSRAMEIKGPGRIGTAAVKRKSASGQAAGGFAVGGAADSQSGVVAGPGPIAALDSILMLQGMDDSTQGRSKGLAHGEQILELLDQVRDGLLAGGIPRTRLNRVAVAVTRRHDVFADPKLQDVLDQIELRAHVELAKLEMLDSERRCV